MRIVNMREILDLSSLVKANLELVEALKYYNSELALQDTALRRHLRAGTIQAFEFTYELTIKFIRRYLEISEPSREYIAAMTYPNLIRTANEKGLLKSDISIWKKYREKRNITSHTYDEDEAQNVMAIIPSFILDAQFLLQQLQNRNIE